MLRDATRAAWRDGVIAPDEHNSTICQTGIVRNVVQDGERHTYESRALYPVSWAIGAFVVVTIGSVLSGTSWEVALGIGALVGLADWSFSRSQFVRDRLQHLRSRPPESK